MTQPFPFDLKGVLNLVKNELHKRGVEFDADVFGFKTDPPSSSEGPDKPQDQENQEGPNTAEKAESTDKETGKPRIKVVCVAPDLQDSVKEMGSSARDQVVMVRVDSQTVSDLDAWLQTGAVKSRSEAAALFIREGLKVRASELNRLKDALRDVEEAKLKLQKEAQKVFNPQE